MSENTGLDTTTRVVHALIERGLTIACAESLTGGLLVAELIRVPGASATVRGGVIAYDTRLKHSLLGVDLALLDAEGPVHPEVARQMAHGVARATTIDGIAADIGIATTGVAGPDGQDGLPPGTVYLGISFAGSVYARRLALTGTRAQIRAETVHRAIQEIEVALQGTPAHEPAHS